MQVFIWSAIEKLTTQYHCGGGLVVIAEDLVHAHTLIRQRAAEKSRAKNYYHEELLSHTTALTTDPIFVARVEGATPGIWVFPNAGCC